MLGSGGVSVFALQFARAAGARVLATSSSDDKLARLRELGASDGINYRRTPEWEQEALRVTNGAGVDVVVETSGTGTLNRSFLSLAQQGKVVLIGVLNSGESNPALLMRKNEPTRHPRSVIACMFDACSPRSTPIGCDQSSTEALRSSRRPPLTATSSPVSTSAKS